MVQFSEESPFLQDEGDGQPSAVCSQHVRSLELLKTIVQVDTFLAAVLVLSLVGKEHEQIVRDEDKVQVILQVVTCSVFLAAIAHTVVLMVCTGWRYTLAWYDPLFPAAFSAFGMFLLYVTIADALLIRLRPAEDLDTVGYWMVVLFGLMMPMALAGPTATLQMVLHKVPWCNKRLHRQDSRGTTSTASRVSTTTTTTTPPPAATAAAAAAAAHPIA